MVLGELFRILRFNKQYDVNSSRFYVACVIKAVQYIRSKDIISCGLLEFVVGYLLFWPVFWNVSC